MAQGEAAFQEGRFLAAEGHFLNLQPAAADVVPLGLRLTEIAFRLGNPQSKIGFYQSYLTRSRNWRGVALVVLAGMNARERNWAELENAVRILYQEFGPIDHPFRYNLLYYLARYTRLPARDLKLGAEEMNWFQVCRELRPQQRMPRGDGPRMPYWLRYAWLLETADLGERPEPPDDPESRYFAQLLDLRIFLNREDLNEAARTINALTPLDRELNRGDLRLFYFPLQMEYFQKRAQTDRAEIVRKNLELAGRWVVMPFEQLPDQVQQFKKAVAKKPPATEPDKVVPDASLPLPATDVPHRAPPADENSFEGLERILERNHRGLELKIRVMETGTTYRKIYRHYLLGLYYLKSGRFTSAYENLSLAERLVQDFPFPNLETKVLLGLADYYDGEKNQKQAEWYRIAAMQIWAAPENLPIFVNGADAVQKSPYRALVDLALQSPNERERIHQLLYYGESEHFQNLRRLAFRRVALFTNKVLGHQFLQIGEQLHRLVRDLAEHPERGSTPRRYNDTLDIWNQIWRQALPYYRESNMPSLHSLQERLDPKGRILAFREGETELGVLMISKEQSFAVSLGSTGNFRALSALERFQFLQGRLGPVWRHQGPLFIELSSSLREQGLLNLLRGDMATPENVTFSLSLRPLLAKINERPCRRTLIYGDWKAADLARFKQHLSPADSDWRELDRISRDEIGASLKNYDHLVFAGPFSHSPEGLILGNPDNGFALHDILHHNPELCSLTLVSQKFTAWSDLFDELALINPGSGTAIFLLDEPSRLESLPFSRARGGISFP